MKNIIKNINYYKSRSADKLQSEQVSYIPYLEPNQIECTVNSYIMAGNRHLINQYEHLCIRLRYIKLKSNTYRNRKRYINTNTPMIELVKNNIIQPFALFVDGRFIPWDIISISICPNASYLLINISELDGKFKNIIGLKYAQILTLPDYISYSNKGESLDYNVLCSFNDMGLFDVENPVYSLIIDKDPHVCTACMSTNKRVNALNIAQYFYDTEGNQIQIDKVKLCKENVLLFVNGLFSIGVKENIKRGTEWDYADEDYTDFAPKIQIDQSNEDLGANPDIRFDRINLTINNAVNDDADRYDFVICVNTLYSDSVDNIVNADNESIRTIVERINDGEDPPGYFDELSTPFEMSMDRTVDYDTNVANAIKTMLKYNSNSFTESIKRTSNLEITEYTGEWVHKNKREDNYLWIPRRHNDMVEEFIIVLVNGELYKYYSSVKHKANYCIIPTTGINDEDTIEFLRFKNINNSIFDIVINEMDGFVNHSPDIINENMILFTDEPLQDDPFTYPDDGKQYLPVSYTLERNDEGLIKITLDDEFYYGKNLKVAYKNRYVHAQYIVPSSDYVQYAIDLKEHFAYCNDYSKFLVFHNGRKIDSNFYRIVLPSRTTTPFYEFKLYFSIQVEEYDNIDIIYTPSLMKDIVYTPEIPLSGNVEVDKDILNYGLGSKLFIVWLNGRKVPTSRIKDISSNRIWILDYESSIKNLIITQYIPDIDILIEDFKTNISNWDSAISKVDSFIQLYVMLDFLPIQPGAEERDINEGAIDIKSVMYELIREQYMMNPRVDITDKFIYGYLDVDQTAVEGYDNDGNILFNVADSNHQDNIDGTPWSDTAIIEEE